MSNYGGNYQNAYKKASVNTLDQTKLIIMLYDGAIKNASFAVEHMKSGQIEKVHDCLIKTKNIVTELMATLNMDRGGDIANNLQSLYSYMFSQLIEANMNKKTEPVVVVIDLLKELRAAWTQINSKKKNDAKRQNTPGKGMMQNNKENAEKRISVTG
ncbi:MAG: flagellar export chaperone FliS [SAR324 cluster bacterium]|nr:flagellar export chaperone FliS [SAR324 cluster bacterium]